MVKVAWLFPGQGSQYLNMGQDLVAVDSTVRHLFEQAQSILGFDLAALCVTGPEEALRDTRNAQPAILTTSIALLQLLQAEGLKPDFVAGHSLGEYSALVAAAALPFTDTLKLVAQRSRLMAAADPEGKGAMAAVLGLDRPTLADYLTAVTAGPVEPANYNSPGQIVVSGTKKGLAQLQEIVAARGGKFIPLKVSGPFHSSLMRPAADELRPALMAACWQEPTVPLIANLTAQPATRAQLAENLYQQIYSPVLWEDTLNYLQQNGVTIYLEIGPGKVLSGLVKKTVPQATILNCEDRDSLKKALAILKEV